MSSSWAKKLDAKLATLDASGASKESIQTVANWIAFNRKHAAVIVATLTEKLQKGDSNNNNTWQLIHEVLGAERDNPGKWTKLQDLRVALGEGLVAVLEESTGLPEALDSQLKEWADWNAFGGPSLTLQLKRLYQQNKSGGGGAAAAAPVKEEEPGAVKEGSAAASATKQNEQPTTLSTVKKEETTPAAATAVPKPESSVQRRSSFSKNNQQVEYDFESKVLYGCRAADGF